MVLMIDFKRLKVCKVDVRTGMAEFPQHSPNWPFPAFHSGGLGLVQCSAVEVSLLYCSMLIGGTIYIQNQTLYWMI